MSSNAFAYALGNTMGNAAEGLISLQKQREQQDWQERMNLAGEQRQARLEELREKNATARDVAREGREDSGMRDSYGAKMNNDELAEYRRTQAADEQDPISEDEWKRLKDTDKNMLINGETATVEQVRDLQEANKQRGLIDSERFKSSQSALDSEEMKNLTPEERGKRMSEIMNKDEDIRETWDGDTGKLERIKDIEAKQKAAEAELNRLADAKKELMRLEDKKEAREQNADLRREIAGSRGGSGKGEAGEYKETRQDKINDKTRDDYRALLKDVEGDESKIPKSQIDSINAQRAEANLSPLGPNKITTSHYQKNNPADVFGTGMIAGKSAGKPKGITATNPKTGQRAVSYDGGKSWQPIQ